MRRTMIATPSHDGLVDVRYTYSLVQTIALLAQNGIEAYPVFWPGEALVQRARNELVKIAVESGVDDVLFIDGDQEWEPLWVLSLLQRQVDCVGAPVRKKTDDAELYNVRVASTGILVDPLTHLLIVDAIGTGFMRLSKRALLALWERSEEYEDAGHKCRMVFDVRVIDGKFTGEDVIMCAKLRHAGINVYCDPSFTVSHIGVKTFKGDFLSYLKRLHAAKVGGNGHVPANRGFVESSV